MLANLQDLRWDDVRVFLALYRERGLAGAARRLGLDASTASRRLVALEGALGARLFDRTRDGLSPTEAAERIVTAAEEAEAGVLRLASSAESLERHVEGVVRIAATPGFADTFLPELLARLLARHPGLRIEIDAQVAVADLTRRDADLALRTIRPTSGDLVMTKLLDSRWLLMASPRRAREIGRLARWDAVPWIDWGVDLAHIPPARWLATHAPEVRPLLRTSHGGTLVRCIERGIAVGLMSEHYAGLRAIVPVKLAPPLRAEAASWPVDSLWLVGHRALRDVPRVAAVWRFFVDELGGLEAGRGYRSSSRRKPTSARTRGSARKDGG